MKPVPDPATVSRLADLPNVGPATVRDLAAVGVTLPSHLLGQNAFELYENLCARIGRRQDPCVIDVFLAAIDFMEGGSPRPWWAFTAERKAHLSKFKPSPMPTRRPPCRT